ncbi:MAG: PKD domain-containing protein, partial [Bacteroidia bacterium]
AYCDADADEALIATPNGGSWTSTVPASIVGGATFSPGSVPQADKNQDIWLYYDYQSPNTGCDERDSIKTFVEASPTINILDDEFHVCKPDGSNTIDIDITSTHENVINPLTWGVVPLTGQSGTFSTTTDSTITATFTVSNDTSHRFFVSVSTGNGAQCPADDDLVFVNIHPVPDFTIAPTIPNGCNPVETDFIVTFNNKVLPSPTNAYFWDLGNSTTSTLANPLATYNVDGDNLITLTYTTDRGCDADATTNVEVYPLPIAAFTPDPDNFTTAALP